MKKLLLLALTFISIGTFAQRQDKGLAIQGRFGIMEGQGQMNSFFGAFPKGKATSFSLGVGMPIGTKGFITEANIFFHDFTIPYKEIEKDLTRHFYGANLLAGWSYTDIQPLYLNLKAGGFAGFELVNNGNNHIEELGAKFPNDTKGFNYGVVISPEVEVILARKITATLTYSQYINLNSQWNKQQYSLELGLKYYF